MAVDLDNARMVVLDVVERCADLEEVFTAEVMAATQRWRVSMERLRGHNNGG